MLFYTPKRIAFFVNVLVQYTNFDIGVQPELRDEMIAKAGGASTVPQIFINDEHIGGCDDMMAIEAQGQLDKKLNATLNA